MRMEFQRAIAFNEDLDKVNEKLRTEVQNNYQRLSQRILNDYQAAQLIRAGLNEPAGTQIHKLAKAYFDTYRRSNAPKEVDESGRTLVELLEMEANELEQTLEIKDITEGKDGSANENESD